MRLAHFIRANSEPILQKWDEFAETVIRSARGMGKAAIRDHAREMLLTIAAELDRANSGQPLVAPSEEVAAEAHGVGRWTAGFDINETVSEYRALRASVIAFWTKADTTIQQADFDDLVRFNEAIDESLSASLAGYTAEKEKHERLFHTVMTASPDHVFVLGTDGRFMYANQSLCDLYRIAPDDIVGKTFADLGQPYALDLQQQLAHVVASRERCRGELSYSCGSDCVQQYEYIFAPAIDGGKIVAIAGTARNITERKAAEEESWRWANFDVLTGLPNRRLFRDRLEQDLRHSERTGIPVALMFVDLDRFKAVNDQLGHDAGDSLLQQAAQRIASCVRRTDTVARLSGDEFTVILTEVNNVTHVEVLAQEIVDELAKPFQLFDDVRSISCSVGITLFPDDAQTPDDLLRNADKAMYASKADGRNRYRFYQRAVSQAGA
jgi:diguanylate cyclase (GGDEF)-like protein/PAS domain S-box-containing protein